MPDAGAELPTGAYPSHAPRGDAESGAYFPVSPWKFVALSLLTWGLYELYWSYKNWTFVRARDGSSIVPWGRALFAPLWYPALLMDLETHLPRARRIPGGVLGPSLAYLLLSLSWRLPDPFGLASMLSFVPLLPAVLRIDAATPEGSDQHARNSRWRPRHLVLALLSTPVLAFAVAASIGLIPSTQVTPGWMLWGPGRSFLDRSGVLAPGEEVLYFYSQGLFSFEEDGNILTDRRVISYWTDPDTGQLLQESASFSEIREKAVERGSWIEPTVLTVVRHDGSEFVLALSAEAKGDQLFIRRLEGLLR